MKTKLLLSISIFFVVSLTALTFLCPISYAVALNQDANSPDPQIAKYVPGEVLVKFKQRLTRAEAG